MTNPLKIRVEEFFVESKDPNRSHTILQVTEATDNQEAVIKGSFFALFEIEQGNTRIIKYLQDLAIFLEKFYYDEYVGERNHFEDTILHANQLLRGFEVPANTGVHAILAVVKKNKISFTTHGQPGIWLFAKGTRRAHPLKQEDEDNDSFFPELIEGVLGIQDVMLVGSTHLEDYFTPDRLAKIVHGHNSAEIARHLNRTLSELGSGLSFAGIVAEAVPSAPQHRNRRKPLGSHASIEVLLSGQDQTKELLTPTVFRNARHWFKEQWKTRPQGTKTPSRNRTDETRKQKNTKARQLLEAQQDSFLFGHFLWHIVRTGSIFAVRIVKGSMILVWRGGVLIRSFIGSSPSDRRAAKSILQSRTKSRLSLFNERFRSLPTKKRFVFIALVAVIIIAIGGGGTLLYRNIQDKRLTEFNTTVQQVARLHEEAEAKQIYGADDEARGQLLDAKQLLAQLKSRTREQKQEHEQLEFMITAALADLRHEIPVQPTLLATITEETLAKPRSIGFLTDKIMATSDHTARAVLIEIPSGATREITAPEPLINPHHADDELWWQISNKLFTTDEGGTVNERFDQLNSAADYVIFNRRAYLLQPKENQITTHAPRGENFASFATNWITEETIFPLDAQFLAVDGDMYIFNKTGSVQKFIRGKSVNLNLYPIEPLLDTVTQVWTDISTDFIYILDSKEGRLVVFDKFGKLKKQYKSDELKSATDFLISEGSKKAYFIADHGVMEFDLSD